LRISIQILFSPEILSGWKKIEEKEEEKWPRTFGSKNNWPSDIWPTYTVRKVLIAGTLRLIAVDLLALTSLDQLFMIIQTFFTF
jgi:hypothetical protein